MATINLDQLFTSAAAEQTDVTKTKILDAALDETAAQGLHGLTIEGVARRCKMNRATIYRQIGGREAVMSALALREARRLVESLLQATTHLEQPEAVIIEGFTAALRFARQHPIISRLVSYEPGSIVESANADNAALLRLGAAVMAETVRWTQSMGFANHLSAEDAGDVLARLFSSYVLIPNGPNTLQNDQAAADFAKRVLIPMLSGTKPN